MSLIAVNLTSVLSPKPARAGVCTPIPQTSSGGVSHVECPWSISEFITLCARASFCSIEHLICSVGSSVLDMSSVGSNASDLDSGASSTFAHSSGCSESTAPTSTTTRTFTTCHVSTTSVLGFLCPVWVSARSLVVSVHFLSTVAWAIHRVFVTTSHVLLRWHVMLLYSFVNSLLDLRSRNLAIAILEISEHLARCI
ncbi:hypothetical protein EV401DRAFT_1070068 [Pisolithus croceorrhizus]|nr:hypothetical protein EV401DRAFT_1070068 [Pisolithus croceorrhizus]